MSRRRTGNELSALSAVLETLEASSKEDERSSNEPKWTVQLAKEEGVLPPDLKDTRDTTIWRTPYLSFGKARWNNHLTTCTDYIEFKEIKEAAFSAAREEVENARVSESEYLARGVQTRLRKQMEQRMKERSNQMKMKKNVKMRVARKKMRHSSSRRATTMY